MFFYRTVCPPLGKIKILCHMAFEGILLTDVHRCTIQQIKRESFASGDCEWMDIHGGTLDCRANVAQRRNFSYAVAASTTIVGRSSCRKCEKRDESKSKEHSKRRWSGIQACEEIWWMVFYTNTGENTSTMDVTSEVRNMELLISIEYLPWVSKVVCFAVWGCTFM